MINERQRGRRISASSAGQVDGERKKEKSKRGRGVRGFICPHSSMAATRVEAQYTSVGVNSWWLKSLAGAALAPQLAVVL